MNEITPMARRSMDKPPKIKIFVSLQTCLGNSDMPQQTRQKR